MRFASLVRWSARGAVGLLLVALMVVSPVSAGPPKPHGKPLSEWMDLWFRWALGGDQQDNVKNVRLMPLPSGEPDDGSGTYADPVTFTGNMNVTLKPGTSFVLPLAGWTKEIYLDGSVDPVLDNSVFTESKLLLKIDGKTVIDSRNDDLSDYYVPPTEFDSIIYYDEPTSYGSIGTVGFQALGIVHRPLSVGEHTMTLYSEIMDPVTNLGFIYKNTWHITVKK